MLVNNISDTLGEGPNLYVVVVHGPKHQQPTMWTVRAWDGPAAEAFAWAAAGYDEEGKEECFTDYVCIGMIDPIRMHHVIGVINELAGMPVVTTNQAGDIAFALNKKVKP